MVFCYRAAYTYGVFNIISGPCRFNGYSGRFIPGSFWPGLSFPVIWKYTNYIFADSW